jgi:hypothetical protein
MPDLVQSTKAKVNSTVARVEKGAVSETERNALLSEALADVEKLCDTGGPVLKYMFLHNRVGLLSMCGDHDAALTILQEILPGAENRAKIVDLAGKCYAFDLDFVEEARKENLNPKEGAIHKSDLVAIYLQIA